MSVEIRSAVPGDVPAVNELANALLGTTTFEWTESPHTVADRTDWLASQIANGHPVLVAEDGGLVGWAAYGHFRDTSRWPGYRWTVEHTIHVRESHWNRGVGRALLGALVEHARQSGKRVMVGAIDSTNVRSIAFHARMGFFEVGRLPGIGEKWGRQLDLVLVQRRVDLVIDVDDPNNDGVRALLEQHVEFAQAVTPDGHVHAIGVEALTGPEVVFFTARLSGDPVGIGALKRLDDTHVELKSMHVQQRARRLGVGHAIVRHLLAVAVEQGYQRVSLETGTMAAFEPARRLYAGVGFTVSEPFGEYTVNPFSICMTMALSYLGNDQMRSRQR